MDRITRYLILLFFVIVFLGLAPLIVLYVSGTSFSFNDRDYSTTGILDVQTTPENADIFLNQTKTGKSPKTIRFIDPGTYEVTISKPGYRTWSKRLYIESNQVTYAGSVSDTVILLPDSEPELVTQDKISSLTIADNDIYYVSDQSLKKISSQQDSKPENLLDLPLAVKSITTSNKTQYILIEYTNGQKSIFDTHAKSMAAIPPSFATAQQLLFTTDNTLLAQIGSQLFSYRFGSANPNLILSNILAFNIIDNLVYIAGNEPNFVFRVYSWNGTELTSAQDLLDPNLISGWPDAEELQLLISGRREVFVKTKTKLYRVNQTLELLSDQVRWANFNSFRGELVYRTPTEIWFYNFISNRSELLYRSTETVSDAIIRPNLGYGFVAEKGDSKAIEIDNRDRQNIYQLLNGLETSSLMTTSNDQYLFVHSKNTGQLYRIKISD